jgi:hypothetical protein
VQATVDWLLSMMPEWSEYSFFPWIAALILNGIVLSIVIDFFRYHYASRGLELLVVYGAITLRQGACVTTGGREPPGSLTTHDRIRSLP